MRRIAFLIIVMSLGLLCMGFSGRDDIFFEDFETGDGGLIGSLDWEWGDYAWIGGNCYSDNYPPPNAYSGTHMWGTVLAYCYSDLGNNSGYDTCVNGNPSDDSILTLDVDLTGYDDATLEFYEWVDLYLNWDWAEIYANGNVVFQHCGTGFVAPSAWEMQTVDLTPYVGGTVTLEFHMLASSVVNHAGWYIDDLRIYSSSVPTPTPPCINDGDVTLNGEITAEDAQLAFEIALMLYTPTWDEACAADCNGDVEITAGDAQRIFQTALGLNNCVDPL